MDNEESEPLSVGQKDCLVEMERGVTLAWKDVTVNTLVASKKGSASEGKKLLDKVTGLALPGSLLAIMGSSGAGKSTLLNTLLFRHLQEVQVEGTWTANGEVMTPQKMTGLSGYVQQDDLFIGSLTVREHLVFQAMVRIDGSVTMKEKMIRVETVMEELGLTKSKNTFVGIPGRLKGISGGEKKRLSVACEVLTNPPILFLDEPTSGLDSYMASSVVDSLKKLALQGRTIICTIHQPSSLIFSRFDQLLLLAGGRTAFLGEAKLAKEFFHRCGHAYPENYNPADHLLEVLNQRKGDSEKAVENICDAFQASTEHTYLGDLVETELHKKKEFSDNSGTDSQYRATWFLQFMALLWRNTLIFKRDPKLFKIKLLNTLAVALIYGVLYFQQELTQLGVMNINGALFVAVINLSFSNLYPVMTIFATEMPVFMREHMNGMYRVDTYFFSKQLVMLPVFLIQPVMFMSVLYWLAGLYPDSYKFFNSILIMILLTQVVLGVGYMMSCAFRLDIALTLTSFLTTPLMLVGGFYLNKGSVPVYLSWLRYFSWYYYAFEALMINQWSGVNQINCMIPETSFNSSSLLSTQPGLYLPNEEDPLLIELEKGKGNGCLDSGAKVLDFYDFPQDNLVFDLLYLSLMAVLIRFVALCSLWFKTWRRKH